MENPLESQGVARSSPSSRRKTPLIIVKTALPITVRCKSRRNLLVGYLEGKAEGKADPPEASLWHRHYRKRSIVIGWSSICRQKGQTCLHFFLFLFVCKREVVHSFLSILWNILRMDYSNWWSNKNRIERSMYVSNNVKRKRRIDLWRRKNSTVFVALLLHILHFFLALLN